MSKHYIGINTRYTINFEYFELGSAYQLHLGPNKFRVAIVVQLSTDDITFKYFEGCDAIEIHMTVDELMYNNYEITKLEPDYVDGQFIYE